MKPIGRLQTGAGNLRSRSNGRRLSGFGAALVVLGALPSWWTLGGGGTPAITGNAFDSIGVFAFFCALALLAILIAPDAVGSNFRLMLGPFMLGWSLLQVLPSSWPQVRRPSAQQEANSRSLWSSPRSAPQGSGSPSLGSEPGSLASHRSLTPATIGSLLTLRRPRGVEHTLTE